LETFFDVVNILRNTQRLPAECR